MGRAEVPVYAIGADRRVATRTVELNGSPLFVAEGIFAADIVASLLLDLHRQQETILVVVTHNAELASRFPLRYELTDQQLRPA